MKIPPASPAAPARLTITLPRLLRCLTRLWAALNCAALALVAQPSRAAVTEAWVQRSADMLYPSYDFSHGYKVVCDAKGDIIFVGVIRGDTPGQDIVTLKYSGANGSLLWQNSFNADPGNTAPAVPCVAVDGSGDVVVTGSSFNLNGNADFYTAKYSGTNGALLWESRYNGPSDHDDKPTALALDGTGNVIVTGSSSGAAALGGYPMDYYTAKYAAADGALLWEKRYDGPRHDDDIPYAVAVDGSGNVVVTGTSVNLSLNWDYYTAKYAAANGALLWERRYNGPANSDDRPSAIAVDSSGNAIVTGWSWGTQNSDYYTAKYAAANGALLWEKRYNGPANDHDFSYAVAVDGSGNVVVTGSSAGSIDSSCTCPINDNYTAKYAAANGALLWEKRYNGPGGSTALAVDGHGNVVVTGTTYDENNHGFAGLNNDYYTAKYAAADGALLWQKQYNSPANLGDTATGLALGPDGMIVITGWSMHSTGGAPGRVEFATVVYRENLPPVSITMVPTGVHLQFTGVAGHSYNIERAPAVTGPWSTIATPTAPFGGLIEYTDTNPPTGTAFYRTSAQ